ncbi:MAG: hypothetical protein IPK04_23200 [Bdellovibrionales bacterium]|nr:hypothetical protein [Bdellovibrionales bacterium]
MMNFITKQNGNNEIVNIEFKGKLSDKRRLGSIKEQNHNDLSERLKNSKHEFLSVIILKDRLDVELMHDPKYCKNESVLGVSKIHEEARKRMINKYYSDDEVERIVEQQKYPTKQFNFKNDDYKPSFESKLRDEIYRSQECALIPEIYYEYKEFARYRYDEKTDSDIELSDSEYEKALKILNQELFLPQVYTTLERIYDLPKPFDFWDDRNTFQQYYLVSNGNEIDCVQGGPASSHQRETHGLWGHCFASLAKKLKIRTSVLKYTSRNKLILLHEFNDFKVMHNDLTGNYRADWSKTKSLFGGRLLQSNFQPEIGVQSISEFSDLDQIQ